MDERRNSQRIEIKQPIATSDERSLVLGELFDVSREGVGFYSDSAFALDSTLFVVFSGNDKLRENEFEVMVVRCVEDSNAPMKYRVSAAHVDANMKYLEDLLSLNS